MTHRHLDFETWTRIRLVDGPAAAYEVYVPGPMPADEFSLPFISDDWYRAHAPQAGPLHLAGELLPWPDAHHYRRDGTDADGTPTYRLL